MSGGLDPTEESDGSVTVRLLDDSSATREIRCASFYDAIEIVEEHQYSVTVAKIIDRDDNVVFTSADMEIDNWKTEWEHAKRRLSVDVNEYDCPYDNVACFADDLCVQCEMDAVRDRYQG